MIKKSLYPKTKRISDSKKQVVVTEKLDGSNIGFFRLDDELLIATRNNIIKLSEIDDVKQILYKGMFEWLNENGTVLKNNIRSGSGFFGEWIGMGKLKYPHLDKRVYMFAKANIDDSLEITNILYDHELLIYPFIDTTIPEFIGKVPVIAYYASLPTISELDYLYDKCGAEDRDIEGFVVEYNNQIKKYVRMKNGKLQPHKQ